MALNEPAAARPRRCLADCETGDVVEVLYILFGSLRMRFEEVGVRTGSRLRVRERADDVLHLRLEDGSTMEIGALHATFVEVRPLGTSEPLRPASLPEPGSALHPRSISA